MDLSPAGAAFTRHHEGFVDHWYPDAVGVGTIGIGFTWRSAAFRAWWQKNRPGKKFGPGAKMTRAEADEVLRQLARDEYGAALNKFLGKTQVPQHVWDGAFSPVFNLGPGALNWKWAAALKAGDFTEAARLLRTTGTTARGKKLPGLVSRRKEEAELIALGDYTVGKVYADPMADGVLRRGERGEPVMDLQKALAARGFYKGAVDGIFGYGTEEAVLAFQREAGLTVDGWAGPATLKALANDDAPDEVTDVGGAGPYAPPAPSTPAASPGWLPLIAIFALAVLVGLWVWLGGGPIDVEPSFSHMLGDAPVPADRSFALSGPRNSLWGDIAMQIALSFIAPLVSAAATAVVGWIAYQWQRLLKADFDAKSAAQLHAALERGILAAIEHFGPRADRNMLVASAADYAQTWNGGTVKRFGLTHEDLQQLAAPHLAAVTKVAK